MLRISTLALVAAAAALSGCAFNQDTDLVSGNEEDSGFGFGTSPDAGPADAAPVDAAPGDPDASIPDASPPDAELPDASPPDAGEPTLIETLTIPATGEDVVSTEVLSSAITYTIRASGTVIVNPDTPLEGDAEFINFDNPQTNGGGVDMGLAIDDAVVDGNKNPDWGNFAADHIYEIQFVGNDATITLNYHDGNPGNNSGDLTVEIFEP